MASNAPEFKPLLDQSVGYGVVIGVGFFFAFIMLCLTFLQMRFTDTSPRASEEFTTASRNVKPGLVCCGIVSAWTWSATLLQSSTAAYTFGVSGPWWYGVGGTIQLAIFGMVAAKVKMNANGAHTFLEIVKVRFGTGPHLLFTFYAFLCIMVVCGSLLLGGAATVNALTGMNILAACFLLPIGIAVYVIVGGLRATFVCDWSHTLILFIIIYIFLFRTFGTSPATEGLSGLYDLLVAAGHENPVLGNQNGSYLTMKSNQGLVFGTATILSGFSGIFCDQGYWQRAIASDPKSTTKAYMLGGLSWFAVPFAFASCLGLAARGLQNNPQFPTFPNPLSPSQVSAGLAAPAAAAVVMGKGGAIAVLLVVFMAVTSACSAELIAVSSLFSYDIYKAYLFPNARGPEIVRVSHMFICFWAIWMGCWATILHKANIDLGWLFYVQGVVLSPAVIPIALTVTWRKLTSAGIIAGAVVGASLGMLAWMIGCWKIYGAINVPNLAQPYSAVCSGLTGLLFSGIITVGVSLTNPADYDFKATRAIANLDIDLDLDLERKGSQSDAAKELTNPQSGFDIVEKNKNTSSKIDKTRAGTETSEVTNQKLKVPAGGGGTLVDEEVQNSKGRNENGVRADLTVLQLAFKRAAWYSLTLTAVVAVVVPLPMFFSHYVFSEKFFAFWISVSIIWALLSGTFSVLLPVWESRQEIGAIILGCWRALAKERR